MWLKERLALLKASVLAPAVLYANKGEYISIEKYSYKYWAAFQIKDDILRC